MRRDATGAPAKWSRAPAEQAADEAAGREQRQWNASELGAAVTFGEGGKPDLGRAETDAEAAQRG